jgi:hypothetical protein
MHLCVCNREVFSLYRLHVFAVCPFVLFLLTIVLSVLLRYTDSDCPFGIFKLFLAKISFIRTLLNFCLYRIAVYSVRVSDRYHCIIFKK